MAVARVLTFIFFIFFTLRFFVSAPKWFYVYGTVPVAENTQAPPRAALSFKCSANVRRLKLNQRNTVYVSTLLQNSSIVLINKKLKGKMNRRRREKFCTSSTPPGRTSGSPPHQMHSSSSWVQFLRLSSTKAEKIKKTVVGRGSFGSVRYWTLHWPNN